MPFGPTNTLPFYMAMMKKFKTEWDKLFVIRVLALKLFNGEALKLEEQLQYGIRLIMIQN